MNSSTEYGNDVMHAPPEFGTSSRTCMALSTTAGRTSDASEDSVDAEYAHHDNATITETFRHSDLHDRLGPIFIALLTPRSNT